MDTLEIPIIYKTKNFPLKLMFYVNHIIVDLNGVQVTIERAEEGNYRALVNVKEMKGSKVDIDLIKEVVMVLQSL